MLMISTDSKLDCWWLKGSLHCTTGSGVEFNKIVSRSLNLTISKVTSEHTGRYACQVNGYDAKDFQTCDLELKNGNRCFAFQLRRNLMKYCTSK